MRMPKHIWVVVATVLSVLIVSLGPSQAKSSIQLSPERSELTSTEGLRGLIIDVGWPCESVRKVSVFIKGKVFRVRCTNVFPDYMIEARESQALISRNID